MKWVWKEKKMKKETQTLHFPYIDVVQSHVFGV